MKSTVPGTVHVPGTWYSVPVHWYWYSTVPVPVTVPTVSILPVWYGTRTGTGTGTGTYSSLGSITGTSAVRTYGAVRTVPTISIMVLVKHVLYLPYRIVPYPTVPVRTGTVQYNKVHDERAASLQRPELPKRSPCCVCMFGRNVTLVGRKKLEQVGTWLE